MYLLWQSHSTNKILLALTLLGALCIGTLSLLSNQNALAQDSGHCSSLQGEQVSSALATLRMQTDRIVYGRMRRWKLCSLSKLDRTVFTFQRTLAIL